MTKVYLVYKENGEYSDYRMNNLGIFSTEERAKEAADIFCQIIKENEKTFGNKVIWSKWQYFTSGESWHKINEIYTLSVSIIPYTLDGIEKEYVRL